MKKKIFAGCLCMALLLCFGAQVCAQETSADWNVLFTSENRLDSDFTAANLSSEVYKLQPGDAVTLTLHLQNNNAEPSNWYMTNRVLESLESASGASGGAYEYNLVFDGPEPGADDEETLYTSDTVGGDQSASSAAQNRVGLENATEGLEDYLYLDTLQPGERATVRLRVSLDGETQGNDYQNTLARLQLNFAVDPVVSDTVTVTDRRMTVVQTGDQNRLTPLLLAAGVSGVLLLVLGILSLRERKRAKKAAGKLLCLLLAGALFCAAMPAPLVDAATTYTVRLFPGAQGAIAPGGAGQVSPEDALVLSGVRYGEQVTVNPWDFVTLPGDSKYYIKGIRESGKDELVSMSSFSVTGDKDYVVVYGVSAETVEYTVQYLDEAGNELAPPKTYHGNVGDKPVIAYQYIEGFRPQAYNLGKELTADVSDNVIRFVYTPIDVNVVTRTVIETAPGVTVIEGGGTVIDDEPTPLGPDIPDYVDLDDEPTPLADWKIGEMLKDFATPFMNLPMAARIAIATGAVLLGGAIILLITRKKERKNAQDN